MKRNVCFPVVAFACAVMMSGGGRVMAADQPANVDGTWEMSSQTPRGTSGQTLTIQQNGNTIKGTLKGQRGESPLEGSVTGSKINFTVKRETPNGTFTPEYAGTVDGDSIKGTIHSERFDGEWTAKRAN